jgi:hypothetical protein
MDNHISKESILNPNCWLSLTTIPFIVTLSLIESTGKSLIEMGTASEEIFRGIRLPIIHFHEQDE